MEYKRLNNGVKIPMLGYGVYQIPNAEECERCVLDALSVGYRLIDTAAAYQNEKAVGNAIKKSKIQRDELFITTKLWIQDANYESTKKAFAKSMEKLQLDYLDLYLIHQPFNDYYGAWRAMEELYEEGKVRAIGVCNFMPDRLIDFVSHQKVMPAINQIETHPYCQQRINAKIMQEYGIAHQAWGPFAEGRDSIFTNETLVNIGKKHQKTSAQVILRWLLQNKIIAIPKTVHKNRMQENFDVFNFELSSEEMEQIQMLDKEKSSFFSHYDPEICKWLTNATFNL